MRLKLCSSFDPGSLARNLRFWNERVPLFSSLEVSGSEGLPWALEAAPGADELRVLLFDSAALRAAVNGGIPSSLISTIDGPKLLVVLMPDQDGAPDAALLAGARCELIDGAAEAKRAGVSELFDAEGLRLANLPFSELAYVALGTAIFRRAFARLAPEPKLIAVDCDGTLWRGICAEAGPRGVEIGPAELALHAFLLEQKRAGRLLALVSKNVPADVEAVFAKRPEMGIRREDFVAAKISWDPKAQALRELAAQLNLGLHSFALLDDSPAECAELSAACPEVAVMLRPDSDPAARLRAAWLLDLREKSKGSLGEERTELYRREAERHAASLQAPSFADHVRDLAVRTSARVALETELGRIFELAQRTNQFNTSAGRPSLEQVRAQLGESDLVAVHVSDRFGDYGLCGAAFIARRAEALRLERLLLSCRVLGRGVEADVFSALVSLARARGAKFLEVPIAVLERNQPAQRFFRAMAHALGAAAALIDETASSVAWRFQLDAIAEVPRLLEVTEAIGSESNPSLAAVGARVSAPDWTEIAALTASPAKLAVVLSVAAGESNAPLADGSQGVLQVIGEVMGRDVLATDNLYALGADSLRMMRILARLKSRLGLELPVGEVLHGADVARLLELSSASSRPLDDPDFVAAQLSGLFDDADLPR